MLILVTGASGFVGRALCAELISQGHLVRAAVRRLPTCENPVGFEHVVVGDIDADTNWHDALQGVECVVHLAARVHVMADQDSDPLAAFRKVNRDGTCRLAEQASQCGVLRFVYLSSIKVNGEQTTDRPFSADDPPNPLDPYGVSKAEAEAQLLSRAGHDGMKVVIIRPPLVYGPGVKANFKKMMNVVGRGVVLPFGAIHNRRRLVALANLVDLIVTCLDHPAAAGQIFLAGDNEELSTTDLLRRIGGAMGRPARLLPVPEWLMVLALKMIGKGDMAQRLCGSLQVDISKTREVLGWEPPVSVDEGLKRTAKWHA